jgi:hypothetical protein
VVSNPPYRGVPINREAQTRCSGPERRKGPKPNGFEPCFYQSLRFSCGAEKCDEPTAGVWPAEGPPEVHSAERTDPVMRARPVLPMESGGACLAFLFLFLVMRGQVTTSS